MRVCGQSSDCLRHRVQSSATESGAALEVSSSVAGAIALLPTGEIRTSCANVRDFARIPSPQETRRRPKRASIQASGPPGRLLPQVRSPVGASTNIDVKSRYSGLLGEISASAYLQDDDTVRISSANDDAIKDIFSCQLSRDQVLTFPRGYTTLFWRRVATLYRR